SVQANSTPFKCEKCNKAFTTRTRLKQHSRTFCGGDRCGKCRTVFKSRAALKQHMLLQHGTAADAARAAAMGRFECEECGVKFTNRTNRRCHIKLVHENVRFPCEHCD
ncbi:hypothetical protein PFISCL1PPCAC_25999, partial [Pristionchus fissidentatus]